MNSTTPFNQSPQQPQVAGIPVVSPTLQDPWSIEVLIRKAFQRTKSRILSYFLVQLVSSAVSSLILFLSLVISIVIVGGLIVAKLYILAFIVGLMLFFALVVITVYVSSLFQIVSVKTVITNQPIADSIKSSWPLLYPYLVLTLWQSLFLFGLVPISLFTFFIIYLVWSFLFSFTTFILISTPKRGMEVLWISKDMILSRFWDIVGRYILVTLVVGALTGVATALIGFILSLFGIGLLSSINSGDANATQSSLTIAQTLISMFTNSIGYIAPLVVAPFYISFLYEMYLLLPLTTAPKVPRIWIAIAAISVISIFVVFMYVYFFLVLPEIMKVSQGQPNPSIQLFQQQFQNIFMNESQKALQN